MCTGRTFLANDFEEAGQLSQRIRKLVLIRLRPRLDRDRYHGLWEPHDLEDNLVALIAEGITLEIKEYKDTAFKWTKQGGLTALALPDGRMESLAYDVSADGSVIVG